MKVFIRPARSEDASKMAQVHFAAVRKTGAQFYPVDICAEWSPDLTEARIKKFTDAISSSEEIVFVAEVDNEIAGFASIVPKNFELRAVYVDPKFGRAGVGKLLLDKAELEAKVRGLARLNMNALLSAEAFYRSQGYVEIERIEHALQSGKRWQPLRWKKRSLNTVYLFIPIYQ